jgi:glycosyltransferase involved in cell wall biosynthesis
VQILFIGQQSLSSPSGLGRHWPLAKELAALGHRVRIITLHHDWEQFETPTFIQAGVEISYVGQMQVLKRDGQKSYYPPWKLLQISLQSVMNMRRAILQGLQEGFDIVHLMKPHPVNGLAWLLARQGAHRPHFFLDCDDYELGFVAHRNFVMRYPVTWFENNIPGMARAVSFNTAHAQNRLVAQGVEAKRLFYLPNGVDRSRFDRRDERLEGELRQRYRSVDGPLAIYLGAISIASHAVDLLIQAVSLAKQQVPNLRLLIVGTGSDRQALEQLVSSMGLSDSVIFTGQVEPEDVPSYLRIADISVEPTRSTPVAEGRFPLKIIESLASGLPVVCGAVGDRIPTLAPTGQEQAGLLVDPDDPYTLAQGICSVLQSQALAEKLRSAALLRSEDFYWDRLAPTVLKMYSSINFISDSHTDSDSQANGN